jgi:hypothetical protein
MAKRPNPLKIPIPLEVLLELHRRHQANSEPVYKLAREVGVSRCTLSLRFAELASNILDNYGPSFAFFTAIRSMSDALAAYRAEPSKKEV